VAVFLKNKFDQQFEKDMFNDERSTDGGNKLRTFRTFKNDIKRELYLTEIKDTITRKNITKLRISAHNLHIETGHHVRHLSMSEHVTPVMAKSKMSFI